jgi:hypothetical protein
MKGLGSTLTFTTMVFDNERVCFGLLNTYAFTAACNSFDSETEPAAANPAGVISELEVPKATLSFLQSDKELSCQERPLSVTLFDCMVLKIRLLPVIPFIFSCKVTIQNNNLELGIGPWPLRHNLACIDIQQLDMNHGSILCFHS